MTSCSVAMCMFLWNMAQLCTSKYKHAKNTVHVRRHKHKAYSMAYSAQSSCLVALCVKRFTPPSSNGHNEIAVFDVAAGGRTLCHLGDFMCALLHPVPCAGHGCSR